MTSKAPIDLPADVQRLVSYTELNSSHWWRNAIDRITLAVLWLADGPRAAAQVCEAVGAALGSDRMRATVEASLGRMVASGEVMGRTSG